MVTSCVFRSLGGGEEGVLQLREEGEQNRVFKVLFLLENVLVWFCIFSHIHLISEAPVHVFSRCVAA